MKNFSLQFADNLRNSLKTNKVTQKLLATHLSTTQETVSRWVNGINQPDMAMLIEICLYLGETPNSLLGFGD